MDGQQLDNQLTIQTATNSLNISEMERNSEEFSTAMYYARAILSFSLITLFFKDVWTTLMKTLGVGVDVYEKDQEEKARINVKGEVK